MIPCSKPLEWPSPEQICDLATWSTHYRFTCKGAREEFMDALKLAANIVEPRLGNYLHLYSPTGKRQLIEMFLHKLEAAQNTMDDPAF
jgi:hypothetical protein